ncbi:MAG: hypothetical protein PVF08_06065 [Gammaproteobacteria bacterium]|jgi:hypothetical protein
MDETTLVNGWQRLPSGFDVELRHAIPVRISDNGGGPAPAGATLAQEITALTGLRVTLGEWLSGERPGEHEARLTVSGEQLEEVLRRLALAAAAVFVDRYHKTVDRDDVDWDTLEYDNDFRKALAHCGLAWGDVDKEAYRDGFVEAMHRETRRLAAAPEMPRVEPE